MRGKCPVCNVFRSIKIQEAIGDELALRWVPQFLYQRSYPGKPEYIPPRCKKCYDKAMKKLARKLSH